MRRYIFYFAVAFLAFGFGTFVVFTFYLKTDEISIVEKESLIQNEIEKEFGIGLVQGYGTGTGYRRLNEPVYVPVLHEPTCNNKKLLPIWNELIKESEFQELAKDFYRNADCSIMLDVMAIELNGDGQKELILQGNNPNLCSRTDCRVWIFEKKGNKYKQILQSWATLKMEIANYPDERGLRFSPIKVNGYKTISTKVNSNDTINDTKYTYQFDGDRYQEIECLTFDHFIENEELSIKPCKTTREE